VDTDTRITRIAGLRPQGARDGEEPCLVQIYGPQLGRRFVLLDACLTIGRDEGCHLVLELDNVSRRHCSVLVRERAVFLRDDGSTNGTFLNNVEVSGERELRSGDLIKVGSAIFKFLAGGELGSIEAQYHEEIYRLTIADGLTQAYNKRFLLEFLDREISRCGRHGRPLSVVLFDVDFFKRINDGFGHLAGDFVLRELCALVRPQVRREECFARYGGEEFVLALPETGLEKAVVVADKLRGQIEAHAFVFEERPIRVTLSGGVAALLPAHDGPLAFLQAADERLYEAKRTGRNRIVG
jgi:diguanylate cyclase (GGDEF)-like protein